MQPSLANDFGIIEAAFMGGIGSGNFSVWRSRRSLVEHAVALDIAAITRAGRLSLGTIMEGQWSVAAPLGSRCLAIRYSGDLTNLANANVTFSFRSCGIERHQTVRLVATAPHLGGIRLWFVCPITDKRTRILYLPPGAERFAAREAHNLAYRSQGESDLFRMITQAQNIRTRFNGDLSIHTPFPPRPRSMHQRTYDRLRAKALKIESCALATLGKATPER
jgi:hypothetical protein